MELYFVKQVWSPAYPYGEENAATDLTHSECD